MNNEILHNAASRYSILFYNYFKQFKRNLFIKQFKTNSLEIQRNLQMIDNIVLHQILCNNIDRLRVALIFNWRFKLLNLYFHFAWYCYISSHVYTTLRDSLRIFSARDSCEGKEWRGEKKEEFFVQQPSSLGTTEHSQAHVLIPTNASRLLCHYSPDKAMILEAGWHGLLVESSRAGLRFPYHIRYSKFSLEKERKRDRPLVYPMKAALRVYRYFYLRGKLTPTSSKSKR